MHLGLIQYLESQRERGRIVAKNVGPAALTLFAALHSLAFLERLVCTVASSMTPSFAPWSALSGPDLP